MPLRFPAISLSIAAQPRRLFSSTAARREGSKNHYETLQIPIDATPAEVKKSFYTLSKAHHPDLHPSDPDASKRFVEISSAYATLSIPAKRQAYDLTLPSSHTHTHHSSSSSHPRSGSYHSTSPGGRPASGLSKRRTQFRGPPPSFYRSGGWGKHEAKRAAASSGTEEKAQENMASGRDPGMGPGQMGWGHGNDVPHFDKEGHFRTHEQIEHEIKERRFRRRRMEGEFRREEERPAGVLGQFLLLAGVLVATGAVTSFVFERVTGRPMRKDEGEKKKA